MTSYASLLYFYLLPSAIVPPGEDITRRIVLLVAAGTFLFPATFVYTLVKTGRISGLKMEKAGERNWPLLVTSVIYGTCYYILRNPAIPDFIQLFLLGATCSMVFILLINMRWKISMHMAGIGGLCGALSGYMILGGSGGMILLAGIFLLSGILGTARLYLRAHTEAQVLAGFVLGFALEILLMLLPGGG